MSSVATLQPAAVVYREEQYFDWRVYALIALGRSCSRASACCRGRVWSLEFALGLVDRLGPLDGRDHLSPAHDHRSHPDRSPRLVRLGSDLSADRADRHDSLASKSSTYRPIADYGFWGIRSGRDGERALIARGNRGVRLELTDGSKLLIGSQRPEALAPAIETARRPPT